MAEFAIHEAEAIQVVLVGVSIEEGRAPDGFLSITKDEDAYGTVVGANGEVIRYGTHNHLYTIECTLLPSSKHNDELSVIHAADTLSSTGAGVGVLLVKDDNGTDLCASSACWITKQPDLSFAVEPQNRVWQLKCVAHPSQMHTGTLG